MKKVGIAIDKWKLPIFEKRLTEAKYKFKRHPGLTPDMLILKVSTESIAQLQLVVEAAQQECATHGQRPRT